VAQSTQEQTLRSRKAYIPAGYLGTKRMGELAELGFMFRAASYGIGVAKPYGDSFPYDFLTQHGKRLLRVQVKSCFSLERHKPGFPIVVACHWGQSQMNYSIDDVDFIAAFIAKYDTWYLIPMESLGRKKCIRVYPRKRRSGASDPYEKYQEAWNLLLDENYVEKQRPTSRELHQISALSQGPKTSAAKAAQFNFNFPGTDVPG
jgi:hypothetical protein